MSCIKTTVYRCVCGSQWGDKQAKECIEHFEWKRESGDMIHLQSNNIWCGYHGPTCKHPYHACIESKDWHESQHHQNAWKKHNNITSLYRECDGMYCKEVGAHNKWNLGMKGGQKGIKCGRPKCGVFISIQSDRISEEERNIIYPVIKTKTEMHAEFPGLTGIAPRVVTPELSPVTPSSSIMSSPLNLNNLTLNSPEIILSPHSTPVPPDPQLQDPYEGQLCSFCNPSKRYRDNDALLNHITEVHIVNKPNPMI